MIGLTDVEQPYTLGGMDYPHLRLTRWPFPTVPEQEFCDFIADRKQLCDEIEGLLSTLSRQDTSSIHLVWSWFGAGKTHTLYYFANRANRGASDHQQLRAVYSEFPKAARSFVDLYRSFAAGLDFDEVIDAYLEIATSPTAEKFKRVVTMASPDLFTALHVLATGTVKDQMTAMRWLRGDTLAASEFRQVGIAQRIGTSEEASRILAAIIRLFSLAAQSRRRRISRVLWLIDEFQRIERLPKRLLHEISTGLHSTFNATPTGLAIVLSFSGRPEKTLPSWLTPELRDRIARTKVLILPPMLADDGIEFVKNVLERFRIPEYPKITDPYFPFTAESSQAILEIIQLHEELKPRSIMLAFGAVLQEAEPLIERQELETISPWFAERSLKEYVSTSDLEDWKSPHSTSIRGCRHQEHMSPHFPYQPCRACRNQQRNYPM